jgi:UDP-N-acetylglucosamine 1-carboxyvinyltransferase
MELEKSEKIVIEGGHRLQGSIRISGSKNAALPIMAATIITSDTVELDNLPHLNDVTMMANLISHLGGTIHMIGSGKTRTSTRGKTLELHTKEISTVKAPYELVSKMRASIIILGALLARERKAIVALPGGCAIGTRPVDLHLLALKQLGAEITIKNGYIHADAPNGLKGTEITFDKISVGATENTILAATTAKGTTIIHNAAIEPEVLSMIELLNKMGAKISVKDRSITIDGVEKLNGTKYSIIPDRIEAGSYALATIITGGEVELLDVTLEIFKPIIKELNLCGANLSQTKNGVLVTQKNTNKNPLTITTKPFPEFSTDMQAQFTAFLTCNNAPSCITENIFENRFMHVAELKRMGADITIDGNSINIKPIKKLQAANVTATDLRASMALVIAALAAEGKTSISGIHHLDRGYETLEEKLSRCGAKITRQFI